jgi:hypothetical protein
MIVMREQLNVKQRQAISETPAKGGGGGLVETCFSSLGRMVAFPGKRARTSQLRGPRLFVRPQRNASDSHQIDSSSIDIEGDVRSQESAPHKSGGLFFRLH